MQILDLKTEPYHIPKLAEWHHCEWSYLNPDGNLEQRIEMMHEYLGENFIPSTFIAKTSELMGSAAIIDSDMDTRPDLGPWLASVFVAPAYRGKGVGRALVKHVMQAAQAAGIQELYLFTPDAEGFYQNLGWQIVAKENYRGHEVTIMVVKLTD
jgi:N-acetylglutamate synthase-like GNAT family acetyltransferase